MAIKICTRMARGHAIRERHDKGETYRQIAETLKLSTARVRELAERSRRLEALSPAERQLSTLARNVLLSAGINPITRSAVRTALPVLRRGRIRNLGKKTLAEIEKWVRDDPGRDDPGARDDYVAVTFE